jgi:hypothetical protein
LDLRNANQEQDKDNLMEIDFDEVLRAIAEAERSPTDEELSNAPYVNHYRLENHGGCVQRIYGQLEGHPSIGDPYVTTTPLFAFDPDAGWARTRSRWYLLGPDWQLPNPNERDDMTRAIQRLLKATRDWVAAELHDEQMLKEVVEEGCDEKPIRLNIIEL